MEYNRIIFQTNFNLMYMLLKVILGIWIVYIAFKEQDNCIYICSRRRRMSMIHKGK